jgi:hypothetical protein
LRRIQQLALIHLFRFASFGPSERRRKSLSPLGLPFGWGPGVIYSYSWKEGSNFRINYLVHLRRRKRLALCKKNNLSDELIKGGNLNAKYVIVMHACREVSALQKETRAISK